MKKFRIGIDARFYGPLGKGLGRYTQEVVDNIINQDENNQYVIFLCKENFSEFKTSNPRVKKVLIKSRWYSWSEQFLFPFKIWLEKIDLMHFTHFNVPLLTPVKFVVTVHDLILTKFPTRRASKLGPVFYRIKYALYRLVIWHAVKQSRQVIAVSEFTKGDLMDKFRVNSDKISVIYEGVAKLSKPDSTPLNNKKILEKYNVQIGNFLLYVGNAYPHKNLEGLLQIFTELLQEFKDLKLILVGKEDYFYKRLKGLTDSPELSRSVVFTGYVPDIDLEVFYKKASAYIFPSFYEGFGLPPLEAMAQGCPVISSDQGSLPEVLGEAAYYFNPYNFSESLEKIKIFLHNQDLKNELIAEGYKQIKKYSWQDCAQQTKDIYLKILNKHA